MLTRKSWRRSWLTAAWVVAAACARTPGDSARTVKGARPWSEHGRWLAETQSQTAELEDRIDRLALRVVLEPPEPRRRLEAALAVLYAAGGQVTAGLQHARAVTEPRWPTVQGETDEALATLRQAMDRAQVGVVAQNPEDTWRLLQRLPFARRQDYRLGTEAWLQSLERRVERLRHHPDGTGDRRAEIGAAVARLDVARLAVRERLATCATVAEDDWNMWKAGLRVRVDHLRDEVAERSRQLLAGGTR